MGLKEGFVREAKRLFGAALSENERLAKHCSFRIGGSARLFLMARRLSDLQKALILCGENSVALLVLGRGTNVLVPDSGSEGIVVAVRAGSVRFSEEEIIAESGASLPRLVKAAAERGLAGIEFCSGIPGSVGGAAIMNAGAHGRWIGSLVEEVSALDSTGQEVDFAKENLDFAYRESSLQQFEGIVTGVTFAVEKDDPPAIRKRMEGFLEIRRRTQPIGARCAGSVFKNPPGEPAGRLLELAGCKGMRRGGALVSLKHANFIVNRGGATYADVRGLIEAVRERVKKAHGIDLELEIIDLGERQKKRLTTG